MLLAEHLARTSVETTWENVLRPVLAAIGRRWADLAHGIAVEHLISHIATVELTRAVQPMDPAAGSTGPEVLLSCAPEEQHEPPLVAAGPGWTSDGLAPPVLLVDGLATTVETLTRLHAERDSGSMA
jgi:hypothetical protein